MSQNVKEEPVGFSPPSSSPLPVPHLASSSSPIVIKRAGGTPVSSLRIIDAQGRATPVSLIKANPGALVDSRGKTPFVKIVRASTAAAPTPTIKAEVKTEVKTEAMDMKRFDPAAMAMAVPRKIVPRVMSVRRPLPPKPEPDASPAAPSTSSAASSDVVHEFVVRAPKVGRRRFSVLQFTGGVDFTKCDKAVMQRENNLREFKTSHDIVDAPKSGAGSEYRREQREEARRKKYGLKAREYNPHFQPWMLHFHPTAVKTEVKTEPKSEPKVDAKGDEKKKEKEKGSEMKRFRGNREGGITDNVTYFVFTQCKDGAFEAFPISAWYKMTAAPPYKHLNTDEAEMEFARRGKIRNYMNLMVRRRLQDAYDEGEEEGRPGMHTEEKGTAGQGEAKSSTPVVAREALSAVTKAAVTKVDAEASAAKSRRAGASARSKKKESGKRRSNFLLTEMDDWDDSDVDEDEPEGREEAGPDAGDDSDSGPVGKAKGKSVRRGAGRKQRQADDSEVEDDSEPDDREGEEVDYMTHSSSDEEKLAADERDAIYEEKGVAEEDALKGLLTDASSDEEEKEDEKKEEDAAETPAKRKEAAGGGERSATGGRRSQRPSDDSSSSSSSSDDESDSDLEKESAKVRPILSRLSSISQPAPEPPEAKPDPKAAAWAAALSAGDEPSTSDVSRKRKEAPDDGTESLGGESGPKRLKVAGGGSEGGVTEEAIRRYLLRKPMTAKDLLLKFSRRLPLRKCEISKQIARLLQRMRVQKRNVNGMTLLSLSNT